MNLCDNAALAVAAEGRRGTLTLRLAESPQGHLLEVADDGPGVPEEVRARLFEPYITSRQVGEGMGLGLAISKKILLDHGGDLELAGTSPAGTTFRLLLPYLLLSSEGAPPSSLGREPQVGATAVTSPPGRTAIPPHPGDTP